MSADPGEISIFGHLLELGENEREAELAALEARDNVLATRLRRLLFAHSSPFLEQAAVAATDSTAEATPRTVGPYRVIERLGQGGMGNVYLCEQTSPVHRRLAVKVLRAGMDTREVLARFDAERQALALMTHPGIARILDAGTTEEGRPFFAMDHVPGLPLLAYCARHALDLRQRLVLFTKICAAVQHAHHKGIIHRDIKPSNILVAENNGVDTPVIIDFGIAKALGAQLTGRTLHTLQGNLVGTPEYMSPEQADIGATDVDTRADVYSLGVVLYEMLTGCVPFDFSKSLLSLNSIQRTLRTREAPLASQRVLADVATKSPATRCGMEIRSLANALHGDIDWILHKALEKDRARRYESAAELAADVRRYLDNEPVNAVRPGMLYLLGKFVRRNAVAVAGGALLAALLLGASAYTALQARELETERDRARTEARKAAQVREFLVELFAGNASDIAGRPDVTVREVLDFGASQANAALREQPDVRAALLHAIGRVYLALGLNREAERVFADALAAIETAGGQLPIERDLRVDHAQAIIEQDRVKDAEALLDAVIEGGARDNAGLYAQLYLGELYLRTFRVPEGQQLFRHVLATADATNPGQDKPRALALLLLGKSLFESSRFDDAQPVFDRAIPLLTAAYGESNMAVLQARGQYAALITVRGELERARRYVDETLATAMRVYGREHPATAMALTDVGFVHNAAGNHAEAEKFQVDALRIYERTVGTMNSRAAVTMNNLAGTYHNTGRLEEALAMYARVLGIHRELLGEGSAEAASVQQNIGYLLAQMNRHAEAEQNFREARDVLIRTYSPEHWLVGNIRYGLGAALLAQHRYAEAEIELCAAPPILLRAFDAGHFRVQRATDGVRQLYAAWSQQDPAMAGRKCP